MITFQISGIPAPGGSKKAFVNKHTGKIVVTDMGGQRNKDWRSLVAWTARENFPGRPLEGPLELAVTFIMPRPKSHFTKKGILKPQAPFFCTNRPDTTKLLRCIEDALTGILWQDDSQIVVQTAIKIYGESPGATLTVEAAAFKPPAFALHD